MCVLCHMMNDNMASHHATHVTGKMLCTVPPMSTSGVVLLRPDIVEPSPRYSFGYDADAFIDGMYYQLPGDAFDYTWTF